MGLFDIFKKSTKPYEDESLNLMYELLFCDNPSVYKSSLQNSSPYPWNTIFSETISSSDLEKIASDPTLESRVQILAYRKLSASQDIKIKKLLGVIIEVGLEDGLDVFASYKDGTARYINQSGKVIVWEKTDESSKALTHRLFQDAETIVQKIGPWKNPRKQYPSKGSVRISLLVSDGLYFGEGPIDVLFNDPLASPTLESATNFMKYLTSIVNTKTTS